MDGLLTEAGSSASQGTSLKLQTSMSGPLSSSLIKGGSKAIWIGLSYSSLESALCLNVIPFMKECEQPAMGTELSSTSLDDRTGTPNALHESQSRSATQRGPQVQGTCVRP